jgi:hypothetical protein
MVYGDIPWEEDTDIVNCRLFNSKKFTYRVGGYYSSTSESSEDSNNNNVVTAPVKVDRDVDDLIRSCLIIDDAKRIKLEDILKHKWFQSKSE